MRRRATTAPLSMALSAACVAALIAVVAAPVFAQRWRATDDIPRYEDYLQEALPGAETFRWINRGTPHYRGYKTGPNGEEELVGLGFFTVDFAPKVRGERDHPGVSGTDGIYQPSRRRVPIPQCRESTLN